MTGDMWYQVSNYQKSRIASRIEEPLECDYDTYEEYIDAYDEYTRKVDQAYAEQIDQQIDEAQGK